MKKMGSKLFFVKLFELEPSEILAHSGFLFLKSVFNPKIIRKEK